MKFVKYEKQGRISIISLCGAAKFNLLTPALLEELAQAFDDYEKDTDAWIAILTSEGPDFCAGIDLKGSDEDGGQGVHLPKTATQNPYFNDTYEKPVIAAINGYALGAGFFLALKADLRVATETAVFQISEIKIGLPAGFYPIHSWIIRENLPYPIQAELLAGLPLPAQRAYEVGFVNRLAEKDKLKESAVSFAEEILSSPPMAVDYNLKMLRRFRRMNATVPSEFENQMEQWVDECRSSKDFEEAVSAFFNKS